MEGLGRISQGPNEVICIARTRCSTEVQRPFTEGFTDKIIEALKVPEKCIEVLLAMFTKQLGPKERFLVGVRYDSVTGVVEDVSIGL
jgi:hypothetical protein